MSYNPLFFPTILFAGLLFAAGVFLGRSVRSQALLVFIGTVLAVPGLLCVVYYTHLFDSALWFYNFRTAPWTEVASSGLGLLPGVLYAWWEPETRLEKAVLPVGLFVFVFLPFCKPILDPIELSHLHDNCGGEVCMQSTYSTCGPASAATLMKRFGRAGSERSFAEAAYTSRGGTEIWYLARELRREGVETSFVMQAPDSPRLPSPSIAGVILAGGAGHFIAVLDDSPWQTTIADPLKGKLIVRKSELRNVYHFTGLFLVLQPR